MRTWLLISAGTTIRNYHIDLSFSLFDWMLKYTFDKNRGLYYLYLGPIGIYISDDKQIEEFIKSIKVVDLGDIGDEIYREETRPHGEPLN